MLIGKIVAPGLLAVLISTGNVFAADISSKPLDEKTLAGISAGTSSSTSTSQAISATNTGSTITAGQVTNGAVNFTSSAFSGFNGIGNVVVNTGNNNNIQGTMSVTVMASPNP